MPKVCFAAGAEDVMKKVDLKEIVKFNEVPLNGSKDQDDNIQ